ncbi:MAG: 2,3-diaminopropionate biosynthesis protein SbnA [Actinophytocola sp.]|uniref:2,3-diaminopropionate biosynthesis protein SbnA n=1 Tax=Actinophytocola sp. TaxID=1872138 RepID=UPI003C729AC8
MGYVRRPYDLNADDVYVDLGEVLDRPVIVKCESFNFAGSVKLKAAVSMVTAAEADGRLRPDSVIVESSSGNLGVALSVVAASRGYGFVCVTDPRSSVQNRRQIEALGGQVIVVTEPDGDHGFLGSRLRRVRHLCENNPDYVWLNQYANEHNWRAHYTTTAPEIVRRVPGLDVLFVGAGTTGTLTGCARYLRDIGHPAQVIAVDSIGSVTFGGLPSPRYIPGLGTGKRPEIVDESVIDDIVMVAELDTIRMCRTLAGAGFLFGGSTSTVLVGAQRWLAANGGPATCAVAISPDLGERYLDTIYNDMWVAEHFGAEFLASLRPGPSEPDVRPGELISPLVGGV